MKKVKWMDASIGIALESLGERLRRIRFDPSEEESEGFRIEQRSNSAIHGMFIERETELAHYSLPTGYEFDERRSRISITEFTLGIEKSQNLILFNPPRRLTPFFNALSLASKGDFFTSPINVDLLVWVGEIERIYGEALVTYLDCNSIQLSPKVLGRFAFKGTDDVREVMKKAVGKSTPSIEAARLNLRIAGASISIELSKMGSMKFDERYRDLLIPAISQALARTREKDT